MSSKNRYVFSSESVTEGHPDKVADQISDAVLDAALQEDKTARVACETLVTTGLAVIAGEITTKAILEIPQIAKDVIKDIGYDDPDKGFDWKTCSFMVSIDRQSPDIALGVDERLGKEQGAGDQGMMFGYACKETPELMPMSIQYAHQLTRRLADVRKRKILPFLRPDGKSQVTVEYRDGRPFRVDSVVISAQHDADVSQSQVKEGIIEHVIRPVIAEEFRDKNTKYYINPTGRFVVGGPQGDCGLTGRKIIVDTYGGHAAHGGGAFSGKDPSKVDRSAAYMARYIAKNVVAAGLAERCQLLVAYVIGHAEPVAVHVNDFGTGVVEHGRLSQAIREVFDLRPASIIKQLQLQRPVFKNTAAYGHFGREDAGFTWEKTDRVAELRKAVGV